jgi:hypothetical protein
VRRLARLVAVIVLAATLALDGAHHPAAAARPAQWTVVVSEKTGGATR